VEGSAHFQELYWGGSSTPSMGQLWCERAKIEILQQTLKKSNAGNDYEAFALPHCTLCALNSVKSNPQRRNLEN